jgi:hypothetical protein
MRKRTRSAVKTPIRTALRSDSMLLPSVKNGLGALTAAHDRVLHAGVRPTFADSLALDSALQSYYPTSNRWDYLLGHKPSHALVGMEVHSVRRGEVSVLIAKKQATLDQLRRELRDGRSVDHWLWVASGSVQILDLDKARQRLDQHGITFVGQQVLARHLPRTAAAR